MNMTPFVKFYFGHAMLIIITSYLIGDQKIYVNSTEVNITSDSDLSSESSLNYQNVTLNLPKITKLTDNTNKPTLFTKNITVPTTTSSVSASNNVQRESSNSSNAFSMNALTHITTKVPKISKSPSMNSENKSNDSQSEHMNISVIKNNSGELSPSISSVYGNQHISDKNNSSENHDLKEVTTTNINLTASTLKIHKEQNNRTSRSLSSASNGYSFESTTSASITMIAQETVKLENTSNVSGKSNFNNHATVIENLNDIETTDDQTAPQSSRTTNIVPTTSTLTIQNDITSGNVSSASNRHSVESTTSGSMITQKYILNGIETKNDQTAAQMSKTTISLPTTSATYKEQHDFASGNLSSASNGTSFENTTSASTTTVTQEIVNPEYTTNVSGKAELENHSDNDTNLNDIEITNDQIAGQKSGTTILLSKTQSKENFGTTISLSDSSETLISTETYIYDTNTITGQTERSKTSENSTFPTTLTKVESSLFDISSTESVQVKTTESSAFTEGHTKLEPHNTNSVLQYEQLDTTTLQTNNATELTLSRTRQLKTDNPTVIPKITTNMVKNSSVTSLKEGDRPETTTRNYLTGKQSLSIDQSLTTIPVGRTYSKQPPTTSSLSTKDHNTMSNLGTTGNQLTDNRVNVMKTTPNDIILRTTSSERQQHDGDKTKNEISHTTKITAAESSPTETEYKISNSSDTSSTVGKSPTTSSDFGNLSNSTQSSGHNRSMGVQSYISESSKTSLTPKFKNRTDKYQQVSTGNSLQEIDEHPQRIADGDDTYWPIAVAVSVGVPVIIVIGVTIIVLHRKRKLEKAHSIALQGYIAAPREYYA